MATQNTGISLSPNPSANVVRVSLPADVHNDLKKLQQVQQDILGKLGCMACCSGWDIRFTVQKQFVVDNALTVKEIVAE